VRPPFTLGIASRIVGCAWRSSNTSDPSGKPANRLNASQVRNRRRTCSSASCRRRTVIVEIESGARAVAMQRSSPAPALVNSQRLLKPLPSDSKDSQARENIMTRVCVIATFVIASATAALVALGYPSQRSGVEVTALEAASVRGGQCGSYQLLTNAACTDAEEDTCTSSSSDCDGLCSYTCSATSTYGGSGSFTGSLVSSDCGSTTQSTCTETVCSVGGAPISCCACLSGSNIACGPTPFDVDALGCSGT
jgi:hypothetical protein